MSGVKGVKHGNGSFGMYPAIQIGACQALAMASASSTQSAAVGSSTQLIRIVATQGAWVAIGANPSVDNSGSTGAYVPANVVEHFIIGGGQRVAVTANAAGTAYVCEAVSV